jgi:glycosidase
MGKIMKKKRISPVVALVLLLSLAVASCGASDSPETETSGADGLSETEASSEAEASAYTCMEAVNSGDVQLIDDKYENYYEIFPYSYCDSDGDGIGDLNGITGKLDYLSDLGITAIWLTPICTSPTYHKYDVSDYYSVDPQFGSMEDFENLISECNARGIRVIMDLVVNHSSSEHKWFTSACDYLQSLPDGQEPTVEDCAYYGYYNFSKEYASGWEQVSGTDWYYECQFWGGMPDLNLDSEAVRSEIAKITEFWLGKGVSGFRLDATTSYYTNYEEKNIEFLSWLNETVKAQDSDAYLVGECWENQLTYAKYYTSGVDSFFDFDFADKSGKIATLVKGGSAAKFGSSVVAVQELIKENNPDAIDAVFTSNHDMGRSAGYYPGDGAEPQIKLAQGIAMIIGGNYFLYYGDEIGMKGSGEDENFRAPMQWSSDADAEGMCISIATQEIDMKYGSLETQTEDGNSIYYYVKEGLLLRNMYPEIARGTTTAVEELTDDDCLALMKEWNGTQLLIFVNTSDQKQSIDLSGVSVNGKTADEIEIAGTLLTGTDMVTVSEHIVSMPAYSIELFQ